MTPSMFPKAGGIIIPKWAKCSLIDFTGFRLKEG